MVISTKVAARDFDPVGGQNGSRGDLLVSSETEPYDAAADTEKRRFDRL
jgi:hypothetical protein